jgi:hypothetical protein
VRSAVLNVVEKAPPEPMVADCSTPLRNGTEITSRFHMGWGTAR